LSVATLTCTNQLLFRKLGCIDHLRCHFFPPSSFIRVITHEKVTKYLQWTGTLPPPILGRFKRKKIGIMAKKITPNSLKLSRNASMVA
jgi:hypothetical protein